jgi:hypothetical protein
MQTQTKFWARFGVLGGVYAVLFVIVNVLTGGQPGIGASGTTLVQYYHAHRAATAAIVFLLAVAVVALMFFVAAVRHTLSRASEDRYLASVATAGGAVYAVGLMLMATLMLALVHAADAHLTAAATTFNVLSNEMWVPVVVGLALLGLGTGVAALRSAALPKWLGWVSVAFGALALAGPAGAIAFLLAPVWALATGVVLLRSARASANLAGSSAEALAPMRA